MSNERLTDEQLAVIDRYADEVQRAESDGIGTAQAFAAAHCYGVDVPALLAEVERQRAEIAQSRDETDAEQRDHDITQSEVASLRFSLTHLQGIINKLAAENAAMRRLVEAVAEMEISANIGSSHMLFDPGDSDRAAQLRNEARALVAQWVQTPQTRQEMRWFS